MSIIDELISRSVKGRTTAAEEQQLVVWRQASRDNETYFKELVRLLEAAIAVGSNHQSNAMPTAADLIELAEAEAGDARDAGVVELHRHRRSGTRWGPAFAVAATIGLIALGGAWYHTHVSTPDFQLGAGEFVTGPSETGTVTLSDGTVVRMAPKSRLRVEDTPGRRDVFLTGKAYFSVAKMEEYPFRVRTRGGDAVALGTRFEVKAEEDVRVVVAEGRVALEGGTGRVEVDAGEMSILMNDTPSAPVQVDVGPILDWVGSFVAFQSTPLRKAAAELEREYDTRVIVADSAFADLTITGWYVDRSFEEVITIICGVLGAPCSIQNGTATIGSTIPNNAR
jgi:ferric-dicitrate binding protein FerR (iron transport regulator)